MRCCHRLGFLVQITAAIFVVGCVETGELRYFGERDEVNYYVDQATRIDFAHVHEASPPEVTNTLPPRTVLDEQRDEIWDLGLNECVQIALQNSRILRTSNSFLSPANPIFSAADRVASVYDPSIQSSGVLFGGRGVEAALAAFDAQFSTTLFWGRNELVQNNTFGQGVLSGNTFVSETAQMDASLSKVFGYGGSFELGHAVNYLGTNAPTNLFDTIYTGNVQARYRHPLLAGSGAEFTRIAGPIGNAFGGLTGVSQGVVIARINQDLSLADFEANITNLVKDVEDAYWNLYLTYRLYDTAVTARNSTLRTWRDAKLKRDVGGAPGFTLEEEAQARDQYFDTKARAKQALSEVYEAEGALRRLIGLAVNDGRVIRPADEPLTAKYQPDWSVSIAEALTHRVQLRRQKWEIKSLELQLLAAESLVRPRLDFVASYTVNGFGDDLLHQNDRDVAGTREGLNSMYETITQGNHTGWNAGFVFELPLGQRSAKAQVRNIELRLCKARDVLSAQEQEISHELANAYQNLNETFSTAQEYINRRDAALERVRLTEASQKVGRQTVDMVLRAQVSLAEAEQAYYRAIVSYSQAITALHYREGTLLQNSSVYLTESEWSPEAYELALRRARARSNAIDAEKFLTTEPPEFVESDADWAQGIQHPEPMAVPMVPAPVETQPPVAPPADSSPAQRSNTSERPAPSPLQIPEPPENAKPMSFQNRLRTGGGMNPDVSARSSEVGTAGYQTSVPPARSESKSNRVEASGVTRIRRE